MSNIERGDDDGPTFEEVWGDGTPTLGECERERTEALRSEAELLRQRLEGAVDALDLARGTLKRIAEGCEEPAFGAAMCLGAIDHLTAGGQ